MEAYTHAYGRNWELTVALASCLVYKSEAGDQLVVAFEEASQLNDVKLPFYGEDIGEVLEFRVNREVFGQHLYHNGTNVEGKIPPRSHVNVETCERWDGGELRLWHPEEDVWCLEHKLACGFEYIEVGGTELERAFRHQQEYLDVLAEERLLKEIL